MSFPLVFHHGGKFVKNRILEYKGGIESVISSQDLDRWSYFEASGLVKDLGYEADTYTLWWKIDQEVVFRRFVSDADAMELSEHAVKVGVAGHIYIEHIENYGEEEVVNDPKENVVNEGGSEDGNESETYEELKGITLDESEEERAHGKDDDDGFHDNNHEEAQTPPRVTEPAIPTPGSGSRVVINGTPYRVKMKAKRRIIRKKRDVGASSSAPMEEVDDQEDEYHSEELVSSDPDEEGNEGRIRRPKYEKFRPADLNKNYQFKVGLEFTSLNEFKDAIREWFILNGKEMNFLKNDKLRVRVECKTKCGFLTHVSKVGHKQTFTMKTWNGAHNCGRVLNNTNARARWVAKSVVKRLQTCESVKVKEIMADIRQNYKAGISFGTAWRAKQIAKEMVEGAADKQYGLLWRYAAELTRVNPQNTVKISVDRSTPDAQPRFKSLYFCFDGSKKGFVRGCRPIICVDGCHLKTKFGGQLLVAVGRDPNDQYFPFAFGVVETETKESWRWFLTLLLEDIGQDRRWVFISDQQKVKLLFSVLCK